MRDATTTTCIAAICAGLLLAACSSTSHLLISPPRPAIPVAQVRVYFEPPRERYIEIALLETASGPFTYGEQNKTDAVLAHLRTEAAKLGANGVLLQGMAQGYDGSRVGVGVSGGSLGGSSHVGAGVGVDISPTQKHARAIAILVGDAPPPAQPAASPSP